MQFQSALLQKHNEANIDSFSALSAAQLCGWMGRIEAVDYSLADCDENSWAPDVTENTDSLKYLWDF